MKNHMKKLLSLLLAVLMMASLSVTAFAEDTGTLTDSDLDAEKTLTYTVVHESDYTNMSGVKLSWSVPIVKYTKDTATVWNTTKLCWEKTVTETVGEGTNTATFTLVNRSSEAVIANATFALEDSLKKDAGNTEDKDAASVSFDKNDVPLESIVDATTKEKKTEQGQTDEDYLAAHCKTTITATVSIDDASKLTTGSGKLGTYTVSIRSTKPTVTVNYSQDGNAPTATTQKVPSGTTITVNDKVLTIGEKSYTSSDTAPDGDFRRWEYSTDGTTYTAITESMTVTGDMTIRAAYGYLVYLDNVEGNSDEPCGAFYTIVCPKGSEVTANDTSITLRNKNGDVIFTATAINSQLVDKEGTLTTLPFVAWSRFMLYNNRPMFAVKEDDNGVSYGNLTNGAVIEVTSDLYFAPFYA